MNDEKTTDEQELTERQPQNESTESRTDDSTDINENKDVNVSIEDTSSETDAEESQDSVLSKLQNELSEVNDKYLRLMAEFDNYRKRVLKEKTELILNGGERVITSILPVLDDCERAEANMDSQQDAASIKEGVSLIFEKLRSTLEKSGLKRLNPVGESFDVDYHEAIAMVPSPSEDQKGKVIDCVQCGYLLNDKVIRHAKVAVAE